MKIIKTNDGQYIKPEENTVPFKDKEINDKYFMWGQRWNRNKQRYGMQLIGHWFKSFEWVDESELPKA